MNYYFVTLALEFCMLGPLKKGFRPGPQFQAALPSSQLATLSSCFLK